MLQSIMDWSQTLRRYLSIFRAFLRDLPTHKAQQGPDMPPLAVRLTEQYLLQALNGITAANYYELGLYSRGKSWKEKRDYVGQYDLPRVYKYLNVPAYEAVARDKIIFHLVSDALRIPTVPIVAVYSRSGGPLPWRCLRSPEELADFLAEARAENLFFKTGAGSYGGGALAIGERVGNGSWRKVPLQERIGVDEIVRHLDGYVDNQTWIIQDRIRPHPDLAAVVPDVCPTLRIMTLNQGEVRVTGAVLRFGDGDVPADNAGAGGIAFFVDESGKLGRGVHSVNGRSVFRTAHHRTAVQVSGANVPFWTQALELAMESARKLPKLTYLGWDIAITADGPLVVETNSASGVLSLQKLNDKGLLAGPMRAVIDPFQGITRSGITLYAANERGGIVTPLATVRSRSPGGPR